MAELPPRASLRRSSPTTPVSSKATVGILTVNGDPRAAIGGLRLPEDASLAIVSDDLDALERMRAGSQARFGALRKVHALEPGGAASGIRPEAYEPSARSLALLKGLQTAAADLKDAGGAFTQEQVRTLMGGVSRAAVAKRVREGSLLTVRGPNNRRKFPTLQFSHDGSVVRGLQEVRAALGTSNGWTMLNYLSRPDARLHGRTPIDVLKEGGLDVVVQSAQRVGQQGA